MAPWAALAATWRGAAWGPPALLLQSAIAPQTLQAAMAHVRSVRLKAFKSVTDEWLEVPFDRGLNAVVGERANAAL